MENKLKILFDYQRFEKNDRLQRLIDRSLSATAVRLNEDDLSLVNAAGDLYAASDTPVGSVAPEAVTPDFLNQTHDQT